ncbi:anti-repressor SinI family protein [Lentibacillus persicus]|nr:anti-repressor SinI family protein [Lentibacillus persicus]
MINADKNVKSDPEWVALIKEAKSIGLTVEDLRRLFENAQNNS